MSHDNDRGGLVPPEEIRAFFASFDLDEKPPVPTTEQVELEAKRQRLRAELCAREAADRAGASLFDLEPVRAGKSPIETALIGELAAHSTAGPGEAPCRDGEPLFAIGSWWAFSQLAIGPYTADIALVRGDEDVGVVVECDGHAFHERTPAQAEHDKRRDRFMVAAGWLVARFAGREINRNVTACALEVFDLLRAKERA